MTNFTVEDRVGIIFSAMKMPAVGEGQMHQLSDVMYTLSEGGALCDMSVDAELALQVWAAVQMVFDGGYTNEMRL